MRPVELTMRGFRSYADEATFNWEGRGLVGIVGPIGSGKSSILDAVAFALFNQTPRVGRSTKTLINQRSDAAHVSLTFEVSGSVYRAVRALRRNGASQHTLYRVDDGAEEVLADRVDEMNQKILGLIGLDFDAFRRSVLLAQNQFAEFLEATPSDRNTVLKGVFGFERLDEMRALVRLRLEEVTGRLAGLESRRQTGDQDRKELKDRQTTLALAQARVELLEGLRGPVAEVAEKRQAAERELAEVTQAGERLSTVADRMRQTRCCPMCGKA
jgi:exonuclease SbcC